jgi:hypothetical protein
MTDFEFAASVAVTVLLAFSCTLYLIDRWDQRRSARQAVVLADQIEAERACALADPTGIDDVVAELMAKRELEPAEPIVGDTLVLVGPGFVHMRCRNARRDAGTPCPECARILAVKR